MRICLVGDYPVRGNGAAGGVAHVMLYLAHGLVAAGNSVSVVSRGGADADSCAAADGIPVQRIKPSRLPGSLTYVSIDRRRAFRVIENLDPEITHFHGAAGSAVGFPRPHVLTIHGMLHLDALYSAAPLRMVRSRFLQAVEAWAMRRCPAVIHISDHARALCIANVRGKTWVVENPVAEDFFGVRRSLQPRVLFSGKISPLKNVLRLLQAFRELGEAVPDAELRLAGPELPGDYGRECRNYVERQGLTGRVRFLGSLGRAEMLDELAAASCLVLLSYQENAPLAIAEAMAAGVPVVGSRVGGIPYMIDEGATGFVVDPDDHLEAAARVRLLLSDPGLNYRFSVECRRVALQRFSLPSVLEKTMSIYQQVLSRERSISSLS